VLFFLINSSIKIQDHTSRIVPTINLKIAYPIQNISSYGQQNFNCRDFLAELFFMLSTTSFTNWNGNMQQYVRMHLFFSSWPLRSMDWEVRTAHGPACFSTGPRAVRRNSRFPANRVMPRCRAAAAGSRRPSLLSLRPCAHPFRLE